MRRYPEQYTRRYFYLPEFYLIVLSHWRQLSYNSHIMPLPEFGRITNASICGVHTFYPAPGKEIIVSLANGGLYDIEPIIIKITE